MVCATCGISEIDDIKLKDCNSCDLVRYCSDECQENHKLDHEATCKKRAAELRDELLFKQPEGSHLGDCPICCLPLSLDLNRSTLFECCSKFICKGCAHANQIREMEMRLTTSCPFCRAAPSTLEEYNKLVMQRVEANDPAAICFEGVGQYDKGDYRSAFEYFTKAAKLGCVEAHSRLSLMYHEGQGVERDMGKEIYHLEEAAIGGHPHARYYLACEEWKQGNFERAVKHWAIAATQGHDLSTKQLMGAFKRGFVEKEDLAAALRANQTALDATKSPHREEAEKYEE